MSDNQRWFRDGCGFQRWMWLFDARGSPVVLSLLMHSFLYLFISSSLRSPGYTDPLTYTWWLPDLIKGDIF